MLRILLGGLMASLVLAFPAGASADYTPLSEKYLHEHTKCDQLHGDAACGRNIVKLGVVTKRAGRDAGEVARGPTAREKAKSIRTLRRLGRPAPVARAEAPTSVQGSGATPGSTLGSGSGLAGIAECESGGDPSAVGGGGRYRGKYQFDLGTWRAYGGTGDPAAAPESEQDRIASRAPRSSWPNC